MADSSSGDAARRAEDIVEISGNKFLELDDRDTTWRVESGSVEVFAILPSRIGVNDGSRKHLFTAAAGDLLFGGASVEAVRLVAVGVGSANVLRIPSSALDVVAASGSIADRSDQIAAVERWVKGTLSGFASEASARTTDHFVDAGSQLTLPAGATVRSARGVLWLRFERGQGRIAGIENIPESSAPVPVFGSLGVECASDAGIEAIDSSVALSRAGWRAGLEALRAALLKLLLADHASKQEAESLRLQRKSAHERSTFRGALEAIASTLALVEQAAGPRDAPADPLFAACREVGAASGIRFSPAVASMRVSAHEDPLDGIVSASRVRTRRVALTADWWRRDNGPLLGYLADGGTPVALLPSSPHGYLLRDPRIGRSVPVGEREAALLSPEAVTFYRPFPEDPVDASDLFRFAGRGGRSDLLRMALMGLGAGLLALVLPVATATIFDAIVPQADRSQLLQICLALLVSAAATVCFTIAQNVALLRIEGRADPAMNAAILDRLLRLPVSFFRRFTAGDLATRALGLSEARRALSASVLTTLLGAIFGLTNAALLFHYDAQLAFLALLLVFIVIVMAAISGRALLRVQREVRDREGTVSGIVLELVTGIAKLRVAGAERNAFAHWAKGFAAQKRLALEARTIAGHLLVVNAVAPVLSFAVIFGWIAGHPQGLSMGAFLAFIAAFSQLMVAVLAIASTSVVVLGLVPVYERARPILQALPETNPDRAHPGDLTGRIELNHVSFQYDPDGPLIVDDVSIQIVPGEFVALVGPSGMGKSTLFRLLLGFDAPQRGSILYDGQDLNVLEVDAVRRQIGVVLQQSKVMVGDILRNIIGTSTLTIDDAWEAARKAGLDDDIREMPMGMHTVVSEGGGTFSGGQKQRLMIARAIARNPKILLFDEATSALDNRTQAVVSESLESLHATRLVIAHRLSTIARADRILVLNRGKIAQSGTFEELMSAPGLFRELAGRQIA